MTYYNLGTDRNDAVRIIADGLGSEGTREQAEMIFDYLRKHDAIVNDGQVFKYSEAVDTWLENTGKDEDIMALWSIILATDEGSDARKMLDYLVDNELFHLVSYLEADGTMAQHWPVWADKKHSSVVGFYGADEDEHISGDDGTFDEAANEYYAEEPTDQRIRVSKSVLKAVKQVQLDEDLKSQNDAIAFLVEFYTSVMNSRFHMHTTSKNNTNDDSYVCIHCNERVKLADERDHLVKVHDAWFALNDAYYTI